ncbi:hypothetical protein HPB48_003381 [Haemaphysalis longicornis]|uniref:DDE Tnp4 domain-containing protein n=1 Tax=Haemaphysalis longicornis TaxID=44386 RepID=A0A9J6GD41_HAELO|nr:hypothetical protein HPB48_003381 [Haemaphysalis longicornis]
MHPASLVLPAFTKGKTQLSSHEVEQTQEIANVRIHLERVIGSGQNRYSILKGSWPVELLQYNKCGECKIDQSAC